MLNITTYIERKKIDSFIFDAGNIEDYFIPLNDCLSIQVANRQLNQHKGHKLDGVVIIKTFDTTITDFMDWDDIDLMWIGILEMTINYKKSGSGVFISAMNNHEWCIKRIFTKPKNLMKIVVKRNPLIFEGTNLYEVYRETNNMVIEADFLSEIIKAAKEYISFREKLFKVDSLGRLKPLISELESI